MTPTCPFYTYAHVAPSGRVIYVGKGKGNRYKDLSPSRRSAWHLNAIKKHAPNVLLIPIKPALTEEQAFADEREWIARARAEGHKLCNLTDGGEGASGQVRTPEAIEKIRQAAIRQWDRQGRKAPKAPRSMETVACVQCAGKIERLAGSRKVICSKRCENDKFRQPYIKRERKPPASGFRGIYPSPGGKWKAGVTLEKVYRHLGTFDTVEQAIAAREAALRGD